MSRRVRVVHVINNLNYGGMEKLLSDLVCGIDQTRYESHVVALKYIGRFGREMAESAQLHVCPPMSRVSLVRPVVLARFLASLRPDIVHTHSGVWYKASRAARMAGVPCVVHTEHGRPDEDHVSRFLDRRAMRRTDRLVAVSRALGAYLERRLAVPSDRIRVIRNGVDVRRLVPRQPSGSLLRELGLHPDQAIIGSVGRLEPVKGYDVVIKAFSLVRNSPDGAAPVLVIGGEGSVRGALEQLATSLGVRDRVFLLGWRDDPEDLYAHFRCFVMGSWSEGTSVSLLEAMASGVAPVVTAVGGNPDVLGEGLARQAVAAGDVNALARAIGEVLDPARAKAVGKSARDRVERAFSLDTTVGDYDALYRDVLSSKKHASSA